jgi:hypothetical protein
MDKKKMTNLMLGGLKQASNVVFAIRLNDS